MDNTQVQATKDMPASGPVSSLLTAPKPIPSLRKSGIGYWLGRVLRPLASLRLTVALFALSIVLVFCGTLAQIDAGIWTVVDQYFRSAYVWMPLQIFANLLNSFFPRENSAWRFGGGFPFPGGWLLGTLLLINLLAAHALRFKLSVKRTGIIVLHAGLIIMMLSELITGSMATEGSMLIFEGQSANYATSPHITELVVMADSGEDKTEVVAVPMKLLRRKGAVIKDEALPFDVEVLDYMVNSQLCKLPMPAEFLPQEFADLPNVPGTRENRANAGLGAKFYVAVDQQEVGGVEQDKEDRPAAYIRFRHKGTGQELGTFLFAVHLDGAAQYVAVDGKQYDVRLRHKRSYKPYSVQLIKFTHEKYPGTEKPRNFASLVRLTEPAKNVSREVQIYMNNPLYYGGETFYQQSFLPGDKATILQVVHNPGWPMPYLSFAMVAAGLLIHFGMNLVGFLSSGELQAAAKRAVGKASSSYLPGAVAAGVGAAYLLVMMIPPGDAANGMNLMDAGKLPAQEGGRVMPLDTAARNSLMVISNRDSFVDGEGKTQPAIKWLLDVMVTRDGEGPAMTHKVFRVENLQLLSLLGLERRKGYRYSLAEMVPRFAELNREYERVRSVNPKEREVFDKKVFDLGQHIRLFQDLSALEVPKVIPSPGSGGQAWFTLRDAINIDMQQKRKQTGGIEFAMMLKAYKENDAKGFNNDLATYQKFLDKQFPEDANKAGFETFFNHFAPFSQCMVLYVLVLILACASWAAYPQQLRQAAFGLAAATLVVHCFALFGRMYLMNRPLVFVTNLYSSAIFIGWVCVMLGLVLEWIYRNGLGTFVAGVAGFITLLIGFYLAGTGDTLEMMQAVLDTNFWLATHVTCVTIGYASTFVAGLLGIVLICRGVFTTMLSKEDFRTVGRMIYGIVCFAMLFSFVGTVLGGLWADYSWGRFWGWDPKENGALLIVLWNALILHARWCGLVQQRGMAILAVFGNVITTWSWFGVNMLGVGLHAYADASGLGLVITVLTFAGSQLVIMGIGLVPMQRWLSFSGVKS